MAKLTQAQIEEIAKYIPLADPAVRERLASGKGYHCKECGSQVKVYARPISKKMVSALRFIANSTTGALSRDILAWTRQGGGGDHAKLSHWGLITQDKQGRWHATDLGREWLAGRVAVARKVLILHGHMLRLDDRQTVFVHDIVDDFDLDEILSDKDVAEALAAKPQHESKAVEYAR